jgi:hypothetical protein
MKSKKELYNFLL